MLAQSDPIKRRALYSQIWLQQTLVNYKNMFVI